MANINQVDPPVLNDTDYVQKILDSLLAIDSHDHTATKGVQIPSGGIAASAIVDSKVSATADIQAVKVKALSNAKVMQSNSSTGRLEASSVTNTELALLSGLTSLTSPTVGVLTLTEQAATQSTPASGYGKLYSKIDNTLYYLDDNGVETALGGGAGSGSASNLEALQTQNQLANIGFPTRMLDNSVRTSGLEVPGHTYSSSRLIEAYSSGGSTIKVVHNPVVIYDSDKDYDSITNWAVVGAGATLATSATAPKVGTNKFTFDKNNSAVDASIRHTLAAQTLSVGANYRVYFWVNMPSVTGFSGIFLKIMGAATTDFSRWNLTTDYSGAAVAVGWNLMFVDIANTAASTTGGTVWTYTQLARYVEIGVTTSSAGQTYTAIAFDGLWFSQGDITAFGNKYLEYTIYDTSNKNNMKVASSNTRYDGVVTLSATVAQNYTAGITVATAAKLVRSSLSWSQAGLIGFDTTLSSGTIALEQEFRLTRLLRESLSGNYGAYVDMFNPQIYKVTTVGGSTIDVADSEDHHLNLLNGDSVHIFSTTYTDGDPSFTLLATRAMTANSSASGGTTTLTLTTTSIAVGDYIVKQNLTVAASVVSSTSDESFSNMSYDTSPNGAQLIGSRSYPNANSVYAHWWLGAASDALALKDQAGNGRTLTKVGSANLADAFKSGKYAASGLSTSSYVRTAASTAQSYDANGEQIQISFWLYYDASNGSARYPIICYSFNGGSTDSGWEFEVIAGGATTRVRFFNAPTDTNTTHASSLNVGWNHVVIQIKSGVYQQYYLNGVLSGTGTNSIAAVASGQALYFGARSLSTLVDTSMDTPSTGLKVADAIVWRDGALLTQSDVNYLYNGGVPQFIGYNPAVLRNEYKVTGSSGRRLSLKGTLNRSTTAVSPYVLDAGMIKVG